MNSSDPQITPAQSDFSYRFRPKATFGNIDITRGTEKTGDTRRTSKNMRRVGQQAGRDSRDKGSERWETASLPLSALSAFR